MKKLILYLIVVLTSNFVFSQSISEETGNLISTNQDVVSVDSLEGYMLVWHDEFNGTSIDATKWQHEVGPYDFNGEVQYYTDRPENSFVQNGKLIIKAIHEHYVGSEGTREFTSARLVTKNHGDWKYGKMIVRAKLPSGLGTWPAIWMMPTESVYGGWPNSGEIDIMEHVEQDHDKIYGTIHTKAYNHRDGTQKGGSIVVPGVTSGFHDYSIEWTEDYISFFVDSTKYFTFENEYNTWREWPFDQKFYMILNLAVGGWGGQEGIDTSAFPTQMEIDYVRVYKKTGNTNKNKYFIKYSGDGWQKHLLNDDGINGDEIPSDGIYSRSITVTQTDNLKLDWVVADTLHDVSHISWFYNPSGTRDILFTYDTNTYEDDYLPETNILNTNEDLGNHFTLVVKGENDTLKFPDEMTDDGNLINGDMKAGDKIYSLHKKISTPGNYIWYVFHNIPNWAEGARWAQYGKISSWNDTASVNFTTSKANQDVYFYLDVNTGRVATITDTVFTSPETAQYNFKYELDNWQNHSMYDDGSHGDVTAGDGIYSLLFNVNGSSNEIVEWKVTDSNDVTVSVPSWFYNTNGSKDILFTFDSNTYHDGWYPKRYILNSNEDLNDFVLVLEGQNGKSVYVNEMTDDGNLQNGDSVANDKIFSLRKNIDQPGIYTWYVYLNQGDNINVRWTHYGKIITSGNLHSNQLVVNEENQGVNFYLNLNTGRISAKADEPVNPPEYKKYYAKHDGDGWQDHLMHDDGLFGDEVANDGIYSRLLTISKNKPGKNDWAVNEGNQQVGTISWFYNPEGTNDILFTLDTKTYNDGWLPKSNIKNTDETALLHGAFGINLDTVAYNNIMTDDGDLQNGDSVAGDNIYSAHFIIDKPGKHKWFVYFGDFDFRRWDANGKQNGWQGAFPDTIDMETTVPNQNVYFYLNVNTGRVKATSDTNLVGIKTVEEKLPDNFKLYQNYPNPFNPSTKIKYTIPLLPSLSKRSAGVGSHVTLKIYDILGREVATLVNKEQPPGTYEVTFNASSLTSGIYFYELKAGGYKAAKNMILLK